jgi:hypothetical protein
VLADLNRVLDERAASRPSSRTAGDAWTHPPDYTPVRRDSNYLENMARTLQDLKGFRTLAHELIQNADDCPAARCLVFELCSDRLEVRDDGGFSRCDDPRASDCSWRRDGKLVCDFHSFSEFAGGAKRTDHEKTGAFGIGFTSVYQITDNPVLVSAGEHWIIDETCDSDDRIHACNGCGSVDHDASGTRIVLPWATDPCSQLRHRLRVREVTPDDQLNLLIELIDVVPRAMLFLRHLTRIEVRQGGTTELICERAVSHGCVSVTEAGNTRAWRLCHGSVPATDVDDDPTILGRDRNVTVAIPISHDVTEGVLYAFLPTQDLTCLPFHINATFFPASDRRRLLCLDLAVAPGSRRLQ